MCKLNLQHHHLKQLPSKHQLLQLLRQNANQNLTFQSITIFLCQMQQSIHLQHLLMGNGHRNHIHHHTTLHRSHVLHGLVASRRWILIQHLVANSLHYPPHSRCSNRLFLRYRHQNRPRNSCILFRHHRSRHLLQLINISAEIITIKMCHFQNKNLLIQTYGSYKPINRNWTAGRLEVQSKQYDHQRYSLLMHCRRPHQNP